MLNMQRSYRIPVVPLFRNLLWKNGARLLLGEAYQVGAGRANANPFLSQPFEWIEVRRRRRRSSIPAWLAQEPPELRTEMERRSGVGGHAGGRSRSDAAASIFASWTGHWVHPFTTLEALEEMFESGRRLGLRLLMPFWDAELVRFLYQVPPRLLNQGGRSKALVRTMLEEQVSSAGLWDAEEDHLAGFLPVDDAERG